MNKALAASTILILLIITACQPVAPKLDDSLVASSTAAMKTVEALSTLLAEIPVSTMTPGIGTVNSTPSPTEITPQADLFTPVSTSTLFPTPFLPLNTCDSAEYLSETIADKSQIPPGAAFVKTWTLRNSGYCTWTKDYRLEFESGEAMTNMTSVAFATGEVKPGDTVTLSVNMVAPELEGEHVGFWKLVNAQGLHFGLGPEGKAFYIQIMVEPETNNPFKVVSAEVSAIPTNFKGICGKNGYKIILIGKIKTNRAGTVTFHWVASGGRIDSTVQRIAFYAADEITVTNSFTFRRGYHEDWAYIFIDYPNNQGFSKVEYNVECTD